MSAFKMTLLGATFIASSAFGGGLDRSNQPITAIFEETGVNGAYFEGTYAYADPEANDATMSDPLGSYDRFAFAYKQQLSDSFSFTLIYDEPYGANVKYTDGTLGTAINAGATLTSKSLTGIARYEFGNGFSIHGGVRAQELKGNILTFNPTFTGSRAINVESDYEFGYVAGVAWERPDIAARVSLTYSSEIDNGFSGSEQFVTFATSAVTNGTTSFESKTPESWNLEFQTGIAANTLLFGSVRYAEWSVLNITTAAGGQYVSFQDDETTYTLGIGRKFNETWSGLASFTYEEPGIRPSNTALKPTTGERRITLGAIYNRGNARITAGVSYGELGDQTFRTIGNWNDNSVIGAGIKIGYRF